ncbi:MULTISPECIES: NAD(+) kinase [unclassified Agarivorans]|uniref:NAD(+) kinase n=1 Tax=unclassified Agarivorans TaxID=2636026 RepID=UPI003D7CE02A
MTQSFNTIGLIGKPHHEGANNTLTALYQWLKKQSFTVLVEEITGAQLAISDLPLVSITNLGEQADLAIVVGGDGNMLGAARVLADYDIAVIGVNRGNLGFLTDLDPDNFEQPLQQVLNGQFVTEKRFLLEAQVLRHNTVKSSNSAVNEVVLHLDKVATMLEFEVYIDQHFILSQRADGIIVTTPTGSTAYSLSAGGPILTPNLDAIALVPMFPHTLSSRPIVVNSESEVKLKLSHDNSEHMHISCDSHISLPVLPGDEVIIRKQANPLRLVHPTNYDYFKILQTKLGWGSRLF